MSHKILWWTLLNLLLLGGFCALPGQAMDIDSKKKEAFQALEKGNPQSAYDTLSSLLRTIPEDTTVHYYYGRAAYELGKYPHALFAFERVLLRHPQAGWARLELGKTLLAMDQFDKAAQEFRTILDRTQDQDLQEQASRYLGLISKKQTKMSLHGLIELGGYHNDNVNLGVEDTVIDTDTGPIQLSKGAKSQSAFGFLGRFDLGLRYLLDQEKDYRLYGGISHTQKLNETYDENDIVYTELEGGFINTLDRSQLRLGMAFEDLTYGWDDLLHIYGLRLEHFFFAPKNMVFKTRIRAEKQYYTQNADRDSVYYSLKEYLRFPLFTDWLHMLVSAGGFYQKAVDNQYSRRGLDILAQIGASLPFQLRPFCGFNFRRSDYLQPASSLQDEERLDEKRVFYAGLRKQLWNENLSLKILFQEFENDSNFDAYTYEKTVSTVSIEYRF